MNIHSYIFMSPQNTQQLADTFKILADETRLKILQLLFSSTEIICVNQIADIVGVSPSATSHQLAKLEARKIVTCSRSGQTMCYRIDDNKLTRMLRQIIFIQR